MPVIKNFVQQHMLSIHSPPSSGEHSTCVSVGSTDSYNKTLQLIDTDVVLYNKYSYGAAVSTSNTYNKINVGVETDSEGILPHKLKESCLEMRKKGFKTSLLYLVPVGDNPCGITMSEKRKKEIYKVCQELDLIIIEDGKF